MKVYYELEPTGDDKKDKALQLMLERIKYMTMWHLRSLEEEINQENGQIIITMIVGEGGIQYNNFSDNLMRKMQQIVEEKVRPNLAF